MIPILGHALTCRQLMQLCKHGSRPNRIVGHGEALHTIQWRLKHDYPFPTCFSVFWRRDRSYGLRPEIRLNLRWALTFGKTRELWENNSIFFSSADVDIRQSPGLLRTWSLASALRCADRDVAASATGSQIDLCSLHPSGSIHLPLQCWPNLCQ